MDYNNYGQNRPKMTTKDWIVTILLLMVPIVNIVFLILWIIDSDKTKPNRRNFSIAYIITYVIAIVLVVVVVVVAAVAGVGAGYSALKDLDDEYEYDYDDDDYDYDDDDYDYDDDDDDISSSGDMSLEEMYEKYPSTFNILSQSLRASSGADSAEVEVIGDTIYMTMDMTEALRAEGVDETNYFDYEDVLEASFEESFAESEQDIQESFRPLLDTVSDDQLTLCIEVDAFDYIVFIDYIDVTR
ncbi:MAG: hypothetical protein K6B67_02510 [Lachnospiraceae bacterium]|nr:hypothetical protein [Lachnospiraceae bacterium]